MHVAIGTIERTRCGYMIAHSSTCIPPIEPPTTACQRAIAEVVGEAGLGPHHVADRDTGNRDPYGRPSTGCGDAGPVVPWQPPSTLEHTTNQRSVSIGRPGPDHRPPTTRARGGRDRPDR